MFEQFCFNYEVTALHSLLFMPKRSTGMGTAAAMPAQLSGCRTVSQK